MPAANPSVLNYNVDDECKLEEADLAFFMQYTRRDRWTDIHEAVEYVKKIWLAVKAKYHTYRCIQTMSFLKPKVQNLSAYPRILETFNAQGCIKVADIGCCFGQETRKLIVDGIPPDMIWAVDVIDGYWKAGLDLYADNEDSQQCISKVHTIFTDPCADNADENLSLNLLTADFDCIVLMFVFHVLSLKQSETLVQRMALMLKRGGQVMGVCIGSDAAREWHLTPDGKSSRYLHSTETLTQMFLHSGFTDVVVTVQDWEKGLGPPRPRWPEEEEFNRVRLEFHATKK
eukprot:766655-Hanusia_phi.AAC.4